MGAYSTIHITESRAKEEVCRFMEQCSAEELGQLMDVILERRLYNCIIVPDDSEENDDKILY